MRSTALVLAIAVVLGLAGCGAPKDSTTPTSTTTTGSTSATTPDANTTAPADGTTGSSTADATTGTTPDPNSPQATDPSTAPAPTDTAKPTDKPAGATTNAPVASDAPKADDMSAVKPLLYPGSKPSGANDGVLASDKDNSLVVTRTTSDAFSKVSSYYANKQAWTSKTTDVEGLAIYESKTGNVRTIVGITGEDGTTTITVTRMTEKS